MQEFCNKINQVLFLFQPSIDLRITFQYCNSKRDNYCVRSHICVSTLSHLPSSFMLYACFATYSCMKSTHLLHSVSIWHAINCEELAGNHKYLFTQLDSLSICLRFQRICSRNWIFFLNLVVKGSIGHCFKIMGILRSKLTLTVKFILYTRLYRIICCQRAWTILHDFSVSFQQIAPQ